MIALLEAKKKHLFSRHHLLNNIFAGLIVGIVAIPLAMAFAIASGVKPEQGLYTAIIAGLLVSIFGGSRFQIAGPTGAFIVILSGIVSRYGVAGLSIATIMAGILLVIMGKLRLGAVLKFIPRPVVIGFTSGIAVIIWVGQWKDFFGLPTPEGEMFHQKVKTLLLSLPTMQFNTTLLSLLALAILIVSPRLIKRIPSPLISMLAITLLHSLFQFKGVATIGSAFGGVPAGLPQFTLPRFQVSEIFMLAGPAFTIALLGGIESLLSAVVADGMTNTKHDSNQELIGQGFANIICPFFGGIAATGAIARTATSIKNGATSPLAGIVHALTVLLTIIFLAPYAANVPLCALAAILFVVAYNMSQTVEFMELLKTAPKTDIFILLTTFLLTVFADLVVAVNVGIAMSSLIFMGRMANSVKIEQDVDAERLLFDGGQSLPAANGELLHDYQEKNVIYTISGPFFFAAADRIGSVIASIQVPFETCVLRFRNVPFIDSTGIDTFKNLIRRMQRNGKRVVLCEVEPYVLDKFRRSGIIAQVGPENIISRIQDLINENAGQNLEKPSELEQAIQQEGHSKSKKQDVPAQKTEETPRVSPSKIVSFFRLTKRLGKKNKL